MAGAPSSPSLDLNDRMDLRAKSALGLFLLLSVGMGMESCSGGGGGGGLSPSGSGSFAIVSCSLGCAGAGGGASQFSCGITNVYINQEIRITFNGPVDLASVNNNSFQLIDTNSGKTPPGTFQLDPADPSVLIYRPLLTVNSSGNPIFGLTLGETYKFKIPGADLDPLGPYVTDTGGKPNRTRLLCTLFADPALGLFDAKPGSPQATLEILRVDASGNVILDPMTGNPMLFPANGAIDVYRFTKVTIGFDDVMNPATLANPVTNQSSTITILVDPDGDPSTTADQIALSGTFTLTVNQSLLTTTVVFTPNDGLPSAGSGSLRKIVVNLGAAIVDLGGNALIGPRSAVFTPEVIEFSTLDISESFDDSMLEDTLRSASDWGSGFLDTGPGGGSGRLGDLVVPKGTTVTLNTDSEDFSAQEFSDPSIFNIRNVVDVGNPATFKVDGGIFEFGRILVLSGGSIRIVGSNPARLYARGEAVIQGSVDIQGRDALAQDPTEFLGGAGAQSGAGGGAGGSGGARPEGENFILVGGTNNPFDPGPTNPLNPAEYVVFNGADGGGIPFPSTLNETSRVAFGGGGLGWPQPGALPPPFDTLHFPVDIFDLTAYPFEEAAQCSITAPSSPGAGGGHAVSGRDAETRFFETVQKTPPPLPPDALGGNSGALQITNTVKSLDPELGLLRGGGGGGGGGSSLFLSKTNGNAGGVAGTATSCMTPTTPFGTVQISAYAHHSGAGGGAGGGGLQIQGGRRVVVIGTLNANGGDGGAGLDPENTGGAQAGGAGAGGAILIQGPTVQIQAAPNLIDIRGGLGGAGTRGNIRGSIRSVGGLGGPGFLRLESFPTPSLPILDLEKTKIVPTEAELATAYGAKIEDILSVGPWNPLNTTTGPTTLSGAQSCWIEPTGNFFRLEFEQDGAQLGWDMQIQMPGFVSPTQSYRGENECTGPGGLSLEDLFGNALGSAPVVVRFQGARAVQRLGQPCAVSLTGITSPVLLGSLTDWVDHPAKLSDFHGSPGLTPNIFRFTVIWDRSNPSCAMIDGLEEITIRVTPD